MNLSINFSTEKYNDLEFLLKLTSFNSSYTGKKLIKLKVYNQFFK